MLIELVTTDVENVQMPTRYYSPEFDDVRSILSDVCEFIENVCYFQVSGFGQDHWPVTTYTDLPVFLEQLPVAIKEISLGNSINLEFYEQGIERIISLRPVEDFYELSCTSLTNWQPNPKIERINGVALKEMMSTILEKFVALIRLIAPELYQHQWIQDWFNAVPI